MNLFIDTEFNGYKGELISIAIVSEENDEFYALVGDAWAAADHDPWVAKHVIPFVHSTLPCRHGDLASVQNQIRQFLMQFDDLHLIADWPDDIRYFCELLITGPGQRIDTPPLTMEIRRDIGSANSLVPHNALADARALKLAWEKIK